jgi:hypothetical protein
MSHSSGDLIDKFRRIAAARAQKDLRRARRLFKTIKVSDFPPMPEFPMSHGVMCDPEGALYFIDHDWEGHGGDDSDWCALFIDDVVRALEQVHAR